MREWQYAMPLHLFDALQQGAMVSFCLGCGRVVRSDRCVPVLIDLFFFPLLYRFKCCLTYYLIHGCQPPAAVGLYLPAQDTVISFFNYSTVISRLDWGYEKFSVLIESFKRVQVLQGAELNAYLDSPHPAQLTLCLGFNPNAGHQVREELGVYQKLLAPPPMDEPVDVIVGPSDYFEAGQWLGPAARIRRLPIQTIHDTGNALLTEVLDKHLFLLRLGTHAHMPASLEQTLRARCEQREQALMALVKPMLAPFFPRVWITLRSHSRVWVNQVDGLSLLMEAILMAFPNACFLIDGLEREHSTLSRIAQHFSYVDRIFSFIGADLLRGLSLFTCADMYVIPFSNANLMPMIVRRPGILYGQRGWIPEGEALLVPREDAIPGQHVVGWRVSTGDPKLDDNPTRANYDLPLAELVEKALNVARSLPLRT